MCKSCFALFVFGHHSLTRNNTQTAVINTTNLPIIGKRKQNIIKKTFASKKIVCLFFCFPTMRFTVMFIKAVCVLFLVTL